jgi:hypothetical protein
MTLVNPAVTGLMICESLSSGMPAIFLSDDSLLSFQFSNVFIT